MRIVTPQTQLSCHGTRGSSWTWRWMWLTGKEYKKMCMGNFTHLCENLLGAWEKFYIRGKYSQIHDFATAGSIKEGGGGGVMMFLAT